MIGLRSPPRMRGKDQVRHLVVVRLGITPAYAGKRKKALLYGDWNRDHPRICGEKERWQGIWNSGVGSPPRMRGKGNVSHYHEQEPRITPAYAGKRNHGLARLRGYTDHPRVCGEKTRRRMAASAFSGSSPRMRGKVSDHAVIGVHHRSTPAHAGKGISLNDWAGFERITPAYAGKSSAPP